MHGNQDRSEPGAHRRNNLRNDLGDALDRDTEDGSAAREHWDGIDRGVGLDTADSDSTRNSHRSTEQRLLTTRAIHEAELSITDVWVRYFSFSGSVAEYEVHAYLQGLINLPRLQRDLIAQAVNEVIDEQPAPRRAPSYTDLDDISDLPRDAPDDQVDD